MSTDADRAAAEKAEADKKVAEDAAAATKAAASAWPTGGYNSFIPLLIIFILAVLAVCVDLSTVCLVRACLDQSQYVINLVNAMLVIYSWINLIEKLPIYSTRRPPEMKGRQRRRRCMWALPGHNGQLTVYITLLTFLPREANERALHVII